MTPPALNQHQIARGFSLLPACAIGRPAGSSRRGRAATLYHSQHQRLTRTERGKLVGMCASTLGVAKTGRRFAGLGCHRRGFELSAPRGYDLLTGRGLVGSGLFSSALSHIDGIGAVAAVPFANLIQNGRQRAFQCLAKCPHSHFSASVINAPNLARGGHDEIHEHSTSGEAQ